MKKIFMFAAIASTMLASCSNEDETTTTSAGKSELGVSAVITGAVVTRGLTDAFAAADTIGVFIDNQTGGETDYTPATATYTYGATNWVAPASGKIYLTNQVATVYAFYPRGVEGDVDYTAKTLKVNVDSVQNFSATSQIDYMFATARSGAEGSYTYPLAVASNAVGNYDVSLFFHHALSKLSFIVNKESSYTGAGLLTSVRLTKDAGFLAGSDLGTVSLGDGVISGLHATYDIVFAGSTTINAAAGTTVLVEGLVAPIVATTGISLTLTIDGKNMIVTLPATAPADAWLQGKNYTYTINVQGTELSVVSVAITAWDDLAGGTTGAN
jgi:hypothetical protein